MLVNEYKVLKELTVARPCNLRSKSERVKEILINCVTCLMLDNGTVPPGTRRVYRCTPLHCHSRNLWIIGVDEFIDFCMTLGEKRICEEL